MKKHSYHHGDLRAALIAEGLRLLESTDADKLSLREVARAVGVSATAVYHHFPDKDALKAALAQAGLDRLAADQHAAAEAAGGGPAGFAATGRAYVRFALRNPSLFRMIFASAPPEMNCEETGSVPDAMAFLKANAASLTPVGSSEDIINAVALQAWALAHGLALLMLDGQVPADDALIDAVVNSHGLLAGMSTVRRTKSPA
jgi:AcrR family transcriptional regulator